jgi:hypothetical protein
MKPSLLACMIALTALGWHQHSARTGDFTKSPTEHIINQIDEPFVVRSVTGVISRQQGGPLPDVVFEIQGPGTGRTI